MKMICRECRSPLHSKLNHENVYLVEPCETCLEKLNAEITSNKIKYWNQGRLRLQREKDLYGKGEPHSHRKVPHKSFPLEDN